MMPSMLVTVAAVSLATIVMSQARPGNAVGAAPDCLHQLERGSGREIACEFPTRLTSEERADLKRITRELLQDAECVVSIRIDRRVVEAALAAGDHVFEPPAQPVRCEIKTRDGTIAIDGQFAPRVVFQDGRAIDATPGLANVTGVSAVLAWPVVQYVNRSQTVRDGMLAAINAYRAQRATRQARGR